MNKLGVILVVLAALIYGFTPALCSFTYELGNNAISLTFFRSFFVLPILATIMLVKKVSFKLTKYDLISLILVGIVGGTLTTLLLYSSYKYVGVGTATTLHFLYPIFVMLILKYFYKDSISKQQIFALVLSFIGVIFFIDPSNMSSMEGIIMALLSGVTFGIYLVLIEKRRLSHMNGYKMSFYLALVVTVSLLIFNLFTNQIIFVQPLPSYLLMLVVAVMASFIAIVCLKEGIKLIGSTQASIYSLVEPISSVFFGAILLNEVLSIEKVIGCVIITLAIGVLSYRKKTKV